MHYFAIPCPLHDGAIVYPELAVLVDFNSTLAQESNISERCTVRYTPVPIVYIRNLFISMHFIQRITCAVGDGRYGPWSKQTLTLISLTLAWSLNIFPDVQIQVNPTWMDLSARYRPDALPNRLHSRNWDLVVPCPEALGKEAIRLGSPPNHNH